MRINTKTFARALTSLALAALLLSAFGTGEVLAAPTPPTIDGVVEPGEWDGATVVQVASAMGEVSVLPTVDYLYVLFEVEDDTDARLGENIHGNDQTSININPTDGTSWGHPFDIIFETGADPNAWGGTSSGTIDGWATHWRIDDVQQATLPADLEVATTYRADGIRVAEWKIPLASVDLEESDNQLCFGGAVDVGDQASYTYPADLDWGNVETYVCVSVPQPEPVGGMTTPTNPLLFLAPLTGLVLLGLAGSAAFVWRRSTNQ